MKITKIVATLTLALTLFVGPVLAVDYPTTTDPRATTGGMVESCTAREAAIKTRMTSLQNLVTNIESKFTAIATRVENYYTNTVVPSGKVVPDYTTLVASISAKQATTAADLRKTQTDITSFSCSRGDLKTLFIAFRTDMQLVKKDLQNYRTAIKNLIVAVRSVTGETESTPSAKPQE